MGAILQIKEYPQLYNFKAELLATLAECIDINEQLRFGDISQLTFEYPIYQVNQYSQVIYDSDGNPVVNPKCQYIINENRVYFNGKWYVIKIDENNRTEENKLTITVVCYEIGYLLQEAMVETLRIIPPIDNPVNATSAINLTLTAMQTARENNIVSASGTSVVIDSNASIVDGFYNGYGIYIKSGTGVGQSRTITSYTASTKTVVVNSAFSPQPDATSVYTIWNTGWRVGTVDSAFNSALRSHEFDFINGWEALQQVRDKYLDSNDETGYLTFSSSWDSGTSRWINYVNLVKANAYDSRDIRYRKNLKSITRRQESDKIYTRIIPQGVDNLTVGTMPTEYRTDSSVTYPTHQLYYNYIDNFQYYLAQGYTYKECIDNFVKVYRFDDARYTDATSLYNDCKKMLQKMSIPKYTYIVSALDLSKMTGREYESFTIGDTLKVIDEDLGIDIYTTVSYIERSWITPQNARIELTNYIDNMGDILKRIIQRNDGYSNLKSLYRNTATYIIADRATSKNWRQADYVIQPFESASYVINKVIGGIDETKGGRVVILDGTYNCNSSIYLKSNVILEGQGSATRFISTINNLLGLYIEGSVGNLKNNISVKNIYFNNFVCNVYMGYVNNIYIENITSPTCYSSGNFIEVRNSNDVNISKNTLGTQGQKYGDVGVYITDSNNVNVMNNTFYGMINDILIFSPLGETTISSNYFEYSNSNDSGNSLFIGTLSPPPANWENTVQLYNINIIDNVIKNNTNKRAIETYKIRNVRIENNKINGGKDVGIGVYGALDSRVMNNTIINNTNAGMSGYYGINIDGSSTFYSGRIELQGNIIQSPLGNMGIVLTSTVQSSFITNNNLTNSCSNPAVNALVLNGNTPTTAAGNRI